MVFCLSVLDLDWQPGWGVQLGMPYRVVILKQSISSYVLMQCNFAKC